MKNFITLLILVLLIIFAINGFVILLGLFTVNGESVTLTPEYLWNLSTPTPNFYTINGEVINNASSPKFIIDLTDEDLMGIPANAYYVQSLEKRICDLEKQVTEMKEKLALTLKVANGIGSATFVECN